MCFCCLSWSWCSVFINFVLCQLFNIWKLSSPYHFTNRLPWMFLVKFSRASSGISCFVHTWAGYQILPCLAQTMSPAVTHSVFYFVFVFAFFTVVCIWLLFILVVMKMINIITFFRHSSCSSGNIFIGGSRFQKAIFALSAQSLHHMIIPRCTNSYPIQLNCAPFEFLYFQCTTFFVSSSFKTIKLFDNKEVKLFSSFLDLKSDQNDNCIIIANFDFRVLHTTFQCTFYNWTYSVTSVLNFMWYIMAETNLCKFKLWARGHEISYRMSRFELTTTAIWHTCPVACIDF